MALVKLEIILRQMKTCICKIKWKVKSCDTIIQINFNYFIINDVICIYKMIICY